MDKKAKIRQLLDRINHILDQAAPGYNGLLGGNSGLALYYFYLSRQIEQERFSASAESVLDYMFETVNSEDPRLNGASYAVGAAGFGLLMNHLAAEEFIDFDVDENLNHLDEYLCQAAIESAAQGRNDFLHQSVGILYYLATKPNVNAFKPQIEAIIQHLDKTAVCDELGWRMVSTFGAREGIHYDLSTAHGLSGILQVLMQLKQAGLENPRIDEIVREGIKFLTYFQRNPDFEEVRYSAFPLSVEIEHLQPDYSNMLAWCYGDFGPTLTIAKAGVLYDNAAWRDNAAEIATHLAKRLQVDNNLVQLDAHFCHGSAGVAQCFKALHRVVNNPDLETAYNAWIDITINLLEEDLSNGTFVGKEIGLLEGMVGVALVLLSAIAETDLHWDKALLL